MAVDTPKQSETVVLKSELVGLFKHIQKIRLEIAMIKSPKTDHFSSMTDELDSIVEATSTATEEIMSNVERINDIAFALSDKLTDQADKDAMNEVIDKVTNVIVACSFQDITGQRIQKIVKAIKYIEGHINSLINMWGQDVINLQKVEKPVETDEYKKYLNGPQLKGQGINQNDVDRMLMDAFPQTSGGSVSQAPATASVPPQTSPAPTSKPVETKPVTQAETTVKPTGTAQAPKPASVTQTKEDDKGPALDQSSIDALFG